MRLLIAAQVVDERDPVLGFFVRWVEELAGRFESLEVVCLFEGAHALPANVRVHSLGKEKRRGGSSTRSGALDTLRYAFSSLRLSWSLRREYDAVFVHQIQEFMLVSGLLWRVLGKPAYLWRNHYAGSFLTGIAAALSTKVFCTSKRSYTARYRRTVLMPVGVDLSRFSPDGPEERVPRSILFLGRVAPSKRHDLFLDALGILKDRGVGFSASIAGPVRPGDEPYLAALKERARALGIEDAVSFLPAVPHDEVPALLRRYEVSVNAAPSGMLDKTIFEAAASGAYVLAASADFAALAGAAHAFDEGSAPSLADALEAVLAGAGRTRDAGQLGPLAREQGLSRLMDRLSDAIQSVRLLIATPLYPPEIGGPATHAVFLERELPAHGIRARSVPFASVRRYPRGIRHALYTMRLIAAGRGADAVFAEDTVSVGYPALIASRLLGLPLLVRVPGDHAWEQARQRFGVEDSIDAFQHRRYGWRVELLRSIASAVVNGADRVIVPSEYFRGIVSGWVRDPGRIRVIYNGIDPDEKPVMPEEAPAHPFLVSVGRLVPWKGFMTLIELLPELPGWSLVIIGDGPLAGALDARARELGVTDRYVRTGRLSRAEVFGWYRAADAFVLNSSFESFSYQVAEALLAEVPVIATGIGSIPELVGEDAGVLVPPDDREAIAAAVRSVRADGTSWKGMTAAGAERARRFSSAATAEQTAREVRAAVLNYGR